MFLFKSTFRALLCFSVLALFLFPSLAAANDFAVIPGDEIIKPLAEVPVEVSDKKFCPEAAIIPPALSIPTMGEVDTEALDSTPVSR